MSSILSGPFADAEAALQRFLDKGAASYEARRNFDYGPANRDNVSQLSKFISHRVLFEYDVAQRALDQNAAPLLELDAVLDGPRWATEAEFLSVEQSRGQLFDECWGVFESSLQV